MVLGPPGDREDETDGLTGASAQVSPESYTSDVFIRAGSAYGEVLGVEADEHHTDDEGGDSKPDRGADHATYQAVRRI